MNPAREVALVVERELTRNVRSVKGLVLGLICVLGGVGTTLAALSSQRYATGKVGGEGLRELRMEAVAAVYGKAIGKALADAPEVLFVMMVGTFSLAALLAALVGFDTVSAELQHRAVRYWTVRTRRASYLLGKFFGMFAVASTKTLLMSVCSWVVILVKSDIPLSAVLGYGPRLWLFTLPVSAAWCGLVIFFSALLRTPMIALLLSGLAWIVLAIVHGVARATDNEPLTWLYPGGFDRLLLHPAPEKWLLGVGASALFAGLFVGAALLIFQRRDA